MSARLGHALLDFIIKSNLLRAELAEVKIDDRQIEAGALIVWSANAPEQIEEFVLHWQRGEDGAEECPCGYVGPVDRDGLCAECQEDRNP